MSHDYDECDVEFCPDCENQEDGWDDENNSDFNAGKGFERERIIALLETEKAYIAIAKEGLILDGLNGLIALIKGEAP